jgi:NDP-sugar pyrophosphorylase family protein
MKAIALAAGLGTRLGSITDEQPKCMIEVGGEPLLWRNLEWASSSGISEVAVNLHHRAEVVTSYFRGRRCPLAIHWSHEPTLLGTAGTIRSLRAWVGTERFVVIYADNLIDCDLHAVVECHERLAASVTVALFEREDVSQSGVAEIDADDRVVRFVEKPAPRATSSHWVSAGLLVFEPEVALLAPSTGDIGRELLPELLAAGRCVAGYRMSPEETLHWVDTPRDLERTRAAFAEVVR